MVSWSKISQKAFHVKVVFWKLYKITSVQNLHFVEWEYSMYIIAARIRYTFKNT